MSLPVTGTLQKALLNLRERRARLMRALVLPTILIAAVGVLIWFVIAAAQIEMLRLVPLLSFLQVPLWCLLAVSCHRVLLDDPDQPTVVDGVWLGRRQLRYLLLAVIVSIPLMIYGAALPLLIFPRFDLSNPSIGSGYLREAAELALLVPLQYVSSRFSLALPAAALREPMSLAQAWSESSGNGLRLTVILLAAPTVVSLLYPLISIETLGSTMAYGVLITATNIMIGVFSIAALSYSYNWFMNDGLGIDYEQIA